MLIVSNQNKGEKKKIKYFILHFWKHREEKAVPEMINNIKKLKEIKKSVNK